MKQLLTLLMLTLCWHPVPAQSLLPVPSADTPLIVYQVSGKVTKVRNSRETPVQKKQYFSLKDKIKIPENGFIKLLDKNQQKMYTLRNKCQGTIATLIENQKQAAKSLTHQYFAYVLRNLTRKDTDPIHNTGLTTGTYRNDADSLLSDIDSLQTVVDSLQTIINTLTTDTIKK